MGVDFVSNITAEVKIMQDNMASLQRLVADLQSNLLAESRERQHLITKTNDRITQELAAETQLRTSLQVKFEDADAKTQSWLATLSKDSVATKDHLAVLEGTVKDNAQKAAMQADADHMRMKQLEQTMPTKAPLEQLLTLQAELSMFKSEVQRDLLSTTQSIKSTAATAAHDFRMCQDGIERAQTHSEAAKKILASELATLATKVETVNAFAHTRAKATDLQALEPRVYEAERSLERTNQELNTKACISTVNNISGGLTGLTMDVQAHQARTLTDKESIIKQIGTVEQALDKHSRKQEADRDQASNGILAVERDTKALKAETDRIGPHTLRAAHDAIANRSLQIEQHVLALQQEHAPYRNRPEALEMAFPTKADAAEIPRLTMAITDSNSRHDATFKRAQEHGMRLDRIDGHVKYHAVKMEGLENRDTVLYAKVSTKAETTDHLTKDNTVELLRDFYRKDEVDAMMSSVCSQVGGVMRGRFTTIPGTSPTSARNVVALRP